MTYWNDDDISYVNFRNFLIKNDLETVIKYFEDRNVYTKSEIELFIDTDFKKNGIKNGINNDELKIVRSLRSYMTLNINKHYVKEDNDGYFTYIDRPTLLEEFKRELLKQYKSYEIQNAIHNENELDNLLEEYPKDFKQFCAYKGYFSVKQALVMHENVLKNNVFAIYINFLDKAENADNDQPIQITESLKTKIIESEDIQNYFKEWIKWCLWDRRFEGKGDFEKINNNPNLKGKLSKILKLDYDREVEDIKNYLKRRNEL